MNKYFSSLEHRIAAIETKLDLDAFNEEQKEIRIELIDDIFNVGWLILGMVLYYLIEHSWS